MNLSRFSLEGKTALVTGARSGIGQAIAVGMAEAGANLVLLGHQDNMQETADLVRQAGREVDTVMLDLSQTDQIEAVCQELLSRHQIDILVNNAGATVRTPAAEFAKADWERIIDINMTSVFLLTQQIARPMLARRAGKIISIASLNSFIGGITVVAYTASKHGVAGITRALSNEWAGYNVQVNAIAPGYVETNLTSPLKQNVERNQMITSRIPAGRWGKPDDIAGAAIYLAAPASDFVNGQLLVVDGGWMAW